MTHPMPLSPGIAPTVAVLYGGEMGEAVARALRARGLRVVTTVAGRSQTTAARSSAAGMELLPTLNAVAALADVVISLVPPSAVECMAAAYLGVADASRRRTTYVDLNSAGPQLKKSLADRFSGAGHAFVDGSINGLATNLTTTASLFLSGELAADVARLFDGAVRTRVLGRDVGDAATMKMLLGGLSKGICALYAELALLAGRGGLGDAFMEASDRIYPDVAQLAARMLPTYARHAARRADEMAELHATVERAGVRPLLTAAILEAHRRLAAAGLRTLAPQGESDLKAFIDQLAADDRFVFDPPSASAKESEHPHGE